MDTKTAFKKEKRDPESVKQWLLIAGFDEQIINEVLIEFARRIEAGEEFGYDGEISRLSLAIRDRVIEVTRHQKGLQSFSDFSDRLDRIDLGMSGLGRELGLLREQSSSIEDIKNQCAMLNNEQENLSEILTRLDKHISMLPGVFSEGQDQLLANLSALQADCKTLSVQLGSVAQILNDMLAVTIKLPTTRDLPEDAYARISNEVWESDKRWQFDSVMDMMKIAIQTMTEEVTAELKAHVDKQPTKRGFWPWR